MMRTLLICSMLIVLSACSTVSAEWQHISHPLLGPPFGPRNEEDTLDVLQVCGERTHGKFFIEMCLGHRLVDGGFYGDNFIYTGRFGVRKQLEKH